MRTGSMVFGLGLVVVLLLATLGNAGSQPDSLLAWHAVLFALLLGSWWFAAPGSSARRPASGVALALLILALVLAAGFVRAPYTYAAWLSLVEVAAFFAVFVLAVRSGDWLIQWMGPALLLAAWFQTGLLIVQRFAIGDPRPAGTFLNPNYLAGWLAATLLFCAGRWIANPTSRLARGCAIAAAPLLVGFLLTGSRGAFVAIAGGGTLLVVLSWPTLPSRRRRVLIAAVVLIGLSAATALTLRMRQPDPFRYQRLKIWQASVMPLLSSPWTGSGPGQFARVAPNLQFPDGRGALRYDRGFRTTHSDWIRVGAELGWPGVVAFGWIVFSVAAHIARRRRSSEAIDAGALAALGGMFVHAAVDNLSRAPAVYLLGGVCLGIVVAGDGPARRNVRPLWRLMVTLVAAHLFLLGEYAPWREWSQTRAVAATVGAGEWNPADAEAAMRGAETRLSATGLDLDDYSAARAKAERAVQLSPRDGEMLRRLGRIEVAAVGLLPLDRAGRERIAGLYRAAAELQRYNPFVPMELAAFLLDAADPVGARRAAEQALEIEPEAVAPRLLLARAMLDLGHAERAARWVEQLEQLARQHADEARTSPYAGDLLAVDPALVEEIRAAIQAARQSREDDPTFGSDHQEDEAGSSRPMD